MSDKKGTTSTRQDARKARLAKALRANLARRKAQTEAHRAGKADQRPQGIKAVQTEPDA